MFEFSHWRSGIVWGFGMRMRATGEPVASGPFCYLADGHRYECGHGEQDGLPEYFGCYARRIV